MKNCKFVTIEHDASLIIFFIERNWIELSFLFFQNKQKKTRPDLGIVLGPLM